MLHDGCDNFGVWSNAKRVFIRVGVSWAVVNFPSNVIWSLIAVNLSLIRPGALVSRHGYNRRQKAMRQHSADCRCRERGGDWLEDGRGHRLRQRTSCGGLATGSRRLAIKPEARRRHSCQHIRFWSVGQRQTVGGQSILGIVCVSRLTRFLEVSRAAARIEEIHDAGWVGCVWNDLEYDAPRGHATPIEEGLTNYGALHGHSRGTLGSGDCHGRRRPEAIGLR